ncbi:ImmA/IrrE family metallo-endopeptidase [Brachybacterium sp. DNPG3]
MREDREVAEAYEPWRHLAGRWPHVQVDDVDDLPAGRLAETNGVDRIRIRRRLLQAERRSALAHELVHLEEGHTTRCSPAVEHAVDVEAARRLIPWDRLLDAVSWSLSVEEIALELTVTPRMLRARISALRADELFDLARAGQDPLDPDHQT